MFTALSSIFKQFLDGQDLPQNSSFDPNLAMAALLCEVAAADNQVDENETQAKLSLLSQLLELNEQEAKELLDRAQKQSDESVSLYEFTSHLRELERSQRFEFIQAMWHVAYADAHIDPMEEAIIRKVAELIYVDHHDFIRAKLNVISD